MHYLDRSGIEAPECLQDYDYRFGNWDGDKFKKSLCKQSIRAQLVAMQGNPELSMTVGAQDDSVRCAYCEGLTLTKGHIEHFWPRKSKPQLTFTWSNLFLSCGSNKHCGHYKDSNKAARYSPDDLVKPDEHDPEKFFFFSAGGEALPREGLNEADFKRAEASINIFNLNEDSLQAKRRTQLKFYLSALREIEDLVELIEIAESETERNELETMLAAQLVNEIAETKYEPYASTIRDFFRSKA